MLILNMSLNFSVGEASGKGPRGLATKVPGRTNMQYLQDRSVGVTGEVARTRQVWLWVD
jgi:hypothetical protein